MQDIRLPPRICLVGATLIVGLGFLVTSCSRTPSAPPAPQRIFLITIDTLRADHLGLYGYARDTSPFLDRLGERGYVFRRAISSASHTAPSHTSLFTSLQPAQHMLLLNGEELNDSVITLAQLMRVRGFVTAGFPAVGFLDGLEQGFDHFEAHKGFFSAPEIVDHVLEWIEGQDPEARLFVWLHFYDVHQWMEDKHLDPDGRTELPRRRGPTGDELVSLLEESHGLRREAFASKEKLLDIIDRYDAQIVAVDREIQRLMETLGTRGLGDGALWVVTADHGEGLGSHGYKGHGRYLYNEQVRVPLIVHWSDGGRGRGSIEELVGLVDVAATLAEAVGDSFDRQVVPAQGRSFLGLIRGEPMSWRSTAAYSQRRPADERRIREGWVDGEVFSMQTPRYKVIHNPDGAAEYYDLEADPLELDDLASVAVEPYADLLGKLEGLHGEMAEDGRKIGAGEINPEHIEQLKALGYL